MLRIPAAPLATPEHSLSDVDRRIFSDHSLDETDPDVHEALSLSPLDPNEHILFTSTPCKEKNSPSFTDVTLESPAGLYERVCRNASASSLVSPRASKLMHPLVAQHSQCPVLQHQPNDSGNQSALSSNSLFCRICHEGACKEDLVSPCHCTGTMGKIHITCAERWLSAANASRCEICGGDYVTRRKAKPLIEWLREPANPSDKRNLVGDAMCFLLLTPLAIISDWLCISGAAHYRLAPATPRWQIIGLVILAVFLAFIYFVWCIVAIRYHVKVFRAWQRQNQVVKIVSGGHSGSPRRTCSSLSTCTQPCTSSLSSADDNNNYLPSRHGSSPLQTSTTSPAQTSPLSRQLAPLSPHRQESSVVVNLFGATRSATSGDAYELRQPRDMSGTTVRLVRETLV